MASADEADLPSDADCEKALRAFAEITNTDEAAAHFFLQDTNWQLQPALDRFFEAVLGTTDGTKNAPSGDSVNKGEVNGDGKEKSPKATKRSAATIEVPLPLAEQSGGTSSKASKIRKSECIVTIRDDNEKPSKKQKSECVITIRDDDLKASSSSAASSSRTVAPLKVLTWNVDGLDDRNLSMRSVSVCCIISETAADVVLLQEVSREVADSLRHNLGGEYHAILFSNPRELYFTAILLKHSIDYIKQDCIPYPNTQMDRTMHIVEAKYNGMPLKVLNTHLESMKEYSEQRVEQLELCFTLARQWDDGKTFVIIAGDLNLRDREMINMPKGFKDAWIEAGSNAKDRFTWDGSTNANIENVGNARCRFDRVFYKSGPGYSSNRFELVGRRTLKASRCHPSDHYGILATFI